MKAFLFAAGLGTRLRPYTIDTPKPLLKVFDKPIIYYILQYLSQIQITDISINTCYLKEKFHDLDNFKEELKISIDLSEQEELYLHGGDLAFATNFLNSLNDDEVFIGINADTLFYIDPKELKSLSLKVNKENPVLVVGMNSARHPLTVQENNLKGINSTFYKPLNLNKEYTTGDSFGVYFFHSSIKDYLCKPGEEMGFYDTDGIVGEVIKAGKNVLYYDAENFKRAEIGNVEDYENYQNNQTIKDIIKLLNK